MLRYFTGENGKHFTAVVLKDKSILSLKRAGEKDKTIYDSLIHWLTSLPEGVTVADIDIKERETFPKPPNSLKKDTITLKDIAPTYDLLRFLLTYEAYALKNSLRSVKDTFKLKTRTYVKDAEGNLHPVKYNRILQKLYSEHHDKLGTTLEEIGFPVNAEIYVNVPSIDYNKIYPDASFDKVNLPFNTTDYKSFYDAKFGFVASPILKYCWGSELYEDVNYHHLFICEYLKEQGYYVFTKFFRVLNNDTIFFNKMFKCLEANMVVVQPKFTDMVIYNYKPMGFVKVSFSEPDTIILEELKAILE